MNEAAAKTVLLNFWAAVADYEQMSRDMPLPQSVNLMYQRSDNPVLFWTEVLHSALLRKFFSPGDDVTISKVIAACRTCMVDQIVEPISEHLDAIESAAAAVWTAGTWGFKVDDGKMERPGQLVKRLLHGHHLHGDIKKRRKLEPYDDGSQIAALYQWNRDTRQVLHLAKGTVWLTFKEREWSDELGPNLPLQP